MKLSTKGRYGLMAMFQLALEFGDEPISLKYRSLEGSLAPADCVLHDTDCTKEENCATKLVMVKIKDSIDSVVDSITLDDMVEDALYNKSN